MNNNELSNFFDSPELDFLLLKVAQDDVLSFRNNNAWLKYHPIDALVFSDIEEVWESLKTAYSNDFRSLVFGNSFPDEAERLYTTPI